MFIKCVSEIRIDIQNHRKMIVLLLPQESQFEIRDRIGTANVANAPLVKLRVCIGIRHTHIARGIIDRNCVTSITPSICSIVKCKSSIWIRCWTIDKLQQES